MINRLIVAAIIGLGCVSGAAAQSRTNLENINLDPRGPAELIVCSQNLNNYGALGDVRVRIPGVSDWDLARKEEALVHRFAARRCDVVAVQEVLGKGEGRGKAALEKLAAALRRATGRSFAVRVGASSDPLSRVGFLVAEDRAAVLNVTSYNNVELPKLSEKQKPRDFARGPLEVQLRVKGIGESSSKSVNIINIHFKSKRGAAEDPAQLEWETYRMEMAEAVRRILELRHKRSFSRGDSILAVVGDRNSNFDVASAKILEGVVTLKSFQGDAPCRLSQRGVPLCQGGGYFPQRMFSVLTSDAEARQQPGTFRMGDVYSWLDDILMPAESLPFAWASYDNSGDYNSGVVYEPADASDHAMVWVALNW